MYSTRMLDDVSEEEKGQWCDIINTFQDQESGWYWPYEWENQNVPNWPWHPTHAAVETLAILGCKVRHELTELDRMLRNETLWPLFMQHYITDR